MHKHKKNKRSGAHKDRQHKNHVPEKIVVTRDDEKDHQEDSFTNPEGLPESLELKHSEVMGRYVVARRDIRAGETLFNEEEALVSGPCQGGRPALCLGCCKPLALPLRLGPRCPDCGWPMCSTACPRADHHRPECELLCSGGATPLAPELLDEEPGLYNAIVPLRCLYLRDNQPDKWKAVMAMQSHNEVRRARPAIWRTNQVLVVDPICVTWGLGARFSELEVHTVCGVLEVNGFEVGAQGRSVRALFPRVYLMAHDCVPNTCHTDDTEGHMSVRAATQIRAGQSVTLSYAYTLQGTLRRRQHLREGKFFECICARCSDPTELGTYCSALMCPRCKAPRVMPSDPLHEDATWGCVSCQDYEVSVASVEQLLRRIGDEAEAIDANDVEGLEEFIVKYRCLLPPSHYLVLGVKHSLSQLYGKAPGYLINDLSEELLRRKRDICREILRVFDVLEPGMSRLRGMTLYELHAPLMLLATRAFESRSLLKPQLQASLKEVVHCLEHAASILSFEPMGSTERSMAEAAEQALVQVNAWRKVLASGK